MTHKGYFYCNIWQWPATAISCSMCVISISLSFWLMFAQRIRQPSHYQVLSLILLVSGNTLNHLDRNIPPYCSCQQPADTHTVWDVSPIWIVWGKMRLNLCLNLKLRPLIMCGYFDGKKVGGKHKVLVVSMCKKVQCHICWNKNISDRILILVTLQKLLLSL